MMMMKIAVVMEVLLLGDRYGMRITTQGDGEQIEAVRRVLGGLILRRICNGASEDVFEAAFRFEDMTDDDYHGVRMMITRLLDGKEYDVGSLAQCIVDQQNIGTIIKSGDENKAKDGDNDDAFCAVATILNPAQYSKEIKGMQQLVEHLRQQVDKHADSDEVKEAFGKMVSATGGISCGIMIDERMINLPSELVPGIHRVLKDDVAWSLSEEAHCPVEEKKYYKFTHLLTSEDAFEAAFRFEDMTDDDYHGVRMMITRLLDGKEYDVGSLAQCIVDQQNIGTIIKSGDENKAKDGDNDDAFCAVATILNPAQYSKEIKGMQQLVEHLRQQVDKHADSDEVKEAFGKMVSATGGIRCGIMINERMINLPSELVPGIHRVLKDDVAWSLSEEAHCPVEEKKYYKFTHLLFLTSYYVDPSAAPSKVMPGGKKVKAAKRKKARLEMEKKERRYICFEDEVFVDHAQWQVTWPFPRGDGIDPETRKMLARKRLLYCVKYDDWKTMVDQLA
ncbi:conserved hypothetical protein [Perkinsus marinus ATCC 50983]|uniref:Uncharacterized protein n=1 Tax=Perkinsus marinus (strain ATCC 50983 / TXsc) TaxID=423536 RepID=C5KJP7_PERM5|nr:conserved hypothetical protein [Perkinsus marinus ATCC 50983]EER15381.1 conserved hypothetical protein [Perkinsus marinus ATCC 50983]|eukprot:XP_002783585.1 conserved hypothetical protein [Perkinsus marinus ATCC 50983]